MQEKIRGCNKKNILPEIFLSITIFICCNAQNVITSIKSNKDLKNKYQTITAKLKDLSNNT